MAIIANPVAINDHGQPNELGIVFVLIATIFWFSVFLRHRWPLVPFILGTILAAAWGDGLLMLVGMFHVISRSSLRRAITVMIIGTVLIIAGVIRLCLQSPTFNPFNLFFITDPNVVPAIEPVEFSRDSVFGMNILTIVAGAIGLAVCIGFGLLLRRTRRLKAVEHYADRETERNKELTAELARQGERDILARELHDTLSHRLSVISLHSGALELGGQGTSDVSNTASALRREAHASLEDLRHLVGGVREGTLGRSAQPNQPTAPPASATMTSIPQLIESVRSTGAIIRPSIIVQDVESAPAVLNSAVYRIIQESLTNAMKHAPGAPVSIDLTVSADLGAYLVVANPVLPPGSIAGSTPQSALATLGSGAGLEGIRERARMLGGSSWVGERDGSFTVEVNFPPFRNHLRR